jgi:hypothetical protein
MQKSQRKIGLISGFTAVFLFTLTVLLWADTLYKIYNRPLPLMDYVPQEIGIGDYLYPSLEANDCRSCHGVSLADRHHYSELALVSGMCTPCHDLTTSPPYVAIERDCAVSGCHSAADLGPLNALRDHSNGWHHYTEFSYFDKCTACHDSDLIDHIADDRYIPGPYPPTILIEPRPFWCGNCHWEQPVIANTTSAGWTNGDPQTNNPSALGEMANAGHPSTFDHNDLSTDYSVEGSTPGPWNDYYEYNRKIESNYDTHHMLSNGNVSTDCERCHRVDPDDPSWNPNDNEWILYCETCHNKANMHVIEPHVGLSGTGNPPAVTGWEAVGFHVPDTDNTDTTDVAPTTSRQFNTNETCSSCHVSYVPPGPLSPPPAVAKITDITPAVGTWDDDITLTGAHFGSELTPDRSVQITSTSAWDWSQVSISSWADTQIEFTIPNGTLASGNYYIWVETEIGNSNVVDMVLVRSSDFSVDSIAPTTGLCRAIITVSGVFAGRDFAYGTSGFGSYISVQIVGPSGTYNASAYGSWTATDFKFRLGDVFEDTDDDYLRDPTEPLNRLCEGFPLGAYDIFVKEIHYQDMDGSSHYNEGDGILKVETIGQASFILEGGLALYAVSPLHIERSHYCPNGTLINGVAKIYGSGFGATREDGMVYIGTGPMYASDKGFALNRVAWADNLIKVGVDVPLGAKGKWLYLWVEKDGHKTDASYCFPGIHILTSETCP